MTFVFVDFCVLQDSFYQFFTHITEVQEIQFLIPHIKKFWFSSIFFLSFSESRFISLLPQKKIKIPFNAFLLSSPTFLCIIKYFALIFCLEKSHLKMPTLPQQKSLIFCWPWHEFWNIFCLCCVSHQIFSFSKISIMVVKTTL